MISMQLESDLDKVSFFGAHGPPQENTLCRFSSCVGVPEQVLNLSELRMNYSRSVECCSTFAHYSDSQDLYTDPPQRRISLDDSTCALTIQLWTRRGDSACLSHLDPYLSHTVLKTRLQEDYCTTLLASPVAWHLVVVHVSDTAVTCVKK